MKNNQHPTTNIQYQNTPQPARHRMLVVRCWLFDVLQLLLVLGILLCASTCRADSQQTYLQCLTNFESYAESIWHTSATIPDSGYWGDGGSTGNGGIRGNSGVAVAYAVLAIAQPNDPRYATRVSRVQQALNYDHNTHVTGSYNTTSGNKWGWSGVSSDWQTPEWAGSMGLACVLLQSNLPAATILGVKRVVVSEANHRAAIAPASGHVSDTKAEENGWQGNILALAAAWMSTSNNASTWLTAAKKYLANTYTIGITNGDPLASWITTYNLYNSWALENHGFYHPTYEMVAGMSSADSLLMAQLANTNVAAELLPFANHNVLNAWSNNMAGMIMDSGDFAYPAGLDWELHDYEQYSFVAWMAAHFNDPLARWSDDRLAQLTLYRQQINGDGRFVGPSGGGFYREAVEARRVAIAWLFWANADFPSGPMTLPTPVLKNIPDVALLTYRGTNQFVSINYGPQTNGSSARIMATIEPTCAGFPSNTIITTPRLPGIIGIGAMGSPTKARLVNLITNATGFFAELRITNGANGTTEVYFNSAGDAVGIIEVPNPVEGFVNSAAPSFSIGIENDPLCGDARLLEWADGSATITNRTGASRNVTNNWICVSGHYGVTFGPAGYLIYTAASGYNRLGAAEDTLAFMPSNSLAPRYAVFFPRKSAMAVSNLAAQVTWTILGTNATLTFPASGTTAQVSALVTTALATNASYPPYPLAISDVSASSYQVSFPPENAANGIYSDFWVSYGTAAGQGPTPEDPEWLLVTFPRQVAISECKVYPRTDNGGYGPKDVELLFNNISVSTNSMSATATLDVKFSPPLNATNAGLYITSSYYRGSSANPQNVQVNELVFFERAQPGTFADWQLQNFSDLQLTNSAIGVADADPEGDGVPNLLEFAVGGSPFISDGTNAVVAGALAGLDLFAFRFYERDSLGDAVRQFQTSGDLLNWTNLTPVSLSVLQSFSTSSLKQAVFPRNIGSQFFRLQYSFSN